MVERCVGTHVTTWSGPGPEHGGLDIGIRRHFSALAFGHPDGGRFYLDGAHVWEPAEQAGGEVLLDDVAEAVRAMARGFPTTRLLADEFQAIHMLQQLRGVVTVEPFSFAVANQCKLASAFYEAISKQLLVLPADLPDLVEEIADLDCKPTGYSFYFESTSGEYGHGDRAVAIALSYYSAVLMGLRLAPAHFSVGKRRATAAFFTGELPYDRQDAWSEVANQRDGRDVFDRALDEDPGSASNAGRRVIW
jgi:hypothetical protein